MANGFALVLPDCSNLIMDEVLYLGWMPEVLPMGSVSGIAYGGVCVLKLRDGNKHAQVALTER